MQFYQWKLASFDNLFDEGHALGCDLWEYLLGAKQAISQQWPNSATHILVRGTRERWVHKIAFPLSTKLNALVFIQPWHLINVHWLNIIIAFFVLTKYPIVCVYESKTGGFCCHNTRWHIRAASPKLEALRPGNWKYFSHVPVLITILTWYVNFTPWMLAFLNHLVNMVHKTRAVSRNTPIVTHRGAL